MIPRLKAGCYPKRRSNPKERKRKQLFDQEDWVEIMLLDSVVHGIGISEGCFTDWWMDSERRMIMGLTMSGRGGEIGRGT